MTPKDGAKIFIKNAKTNKILLVLRDDKPNIPNANCWSLFGGGIEVGEAPLEALERELSEELNIEVYDIQQIDKIEVDLRVQNKDYVVLGYIFVGLTEAGIEEVLITEGQRAEYFTVDEIKELDNLPTGALSMIEQYEKILLAYGKK